ncbi:2,3-diaminopropionate biosynthesis protein SbnA [Haloglycomyces albus]|uniref:2,3-diaminopropionate biosynthesis protein SbnA n=1 Tax=Haloglycomyces albus TaxID=526067 RepID=UPI00046D91DF|nr:2,3-diaminopropionate biosynthesis protein SbnA [Haloglycomyces albus]
MLYNDVSEIITDDIFVNLKDFLPQRQVFLKLEGLNPSGSIKAKAAASLLEDAEKSGRLGPGKKIIESSSGNLGIALSTACAAKGYPLTIVTDANVQESALRTMRALGTRLTIIERPDSTGGFLHQRIDYIHRSLNDDPDLVWLNQYSNPANVWAHTATTAHAVDNELGPIDALFVGTGTSGTLMGCLEFRRTHRRRHTIVAVDSEGSVTFGGPPKRRYIPGLGASRKPEIYSEAESFDKVLIPEADTIAECHRLARTYGLLAGGSTGTVLAAIRKYGRRFPPGARIASISPDMGEKYLPTVYSHEWLSRHPDLIDKETTSV